MDKVQLTSDGNVKLTNDTHKVQLFAPPPPFDCSTDIVLTVQVIISGTCDSGIVYNANLSASVSGTMGGGTVCSACVPSDGEIISHYRTCGAAFTNTLIDIEACLNMDPTNGAYLTFTPPLALIIGNGALGTCAGCSGISFTSQTEPIPAESGVYSFSYSSGGITLQFIVTIALP